MTFVHDPKRGIYAAIRWKRPDEPLPERTEHELMPWQHLTEVLHEYVGDLYDEAEHRLRGDTNTMFFLIQIIDALPEGHPLKEKAIKLTLLHGCLVENKYEMRSEILKWFSANIRRMGAKFPPPPKPEPKPTPKPGTKPKVKSKKHLIAGYRIELEPSRLSYDQAWLRQQTSQIELEEKWRKWAIKRYGSDDSSDIKDGIITKLTEKLIADREFVEAFINSPFNSLYETVDDALKDKENLKKRVYMVVDGLVGVGAQTASDHHPLAWALQIAIAQEFGLTKRYEDALKRLQVLSKDEEDPYLAEEAAFLYDTLKPLLHKYVRAVYEETQEFLNEIGLDEIYLMRGVGVPDDVAKNLSERKFKLIEPPILPASSWTFDYETAAQFASRMSFKYDLEPALYMIKIPKEAFHLILSTALTGWGCFDEGEIILTVPDGQEVWAARLLY
jgi:hypothetical protein